jgi:hypothetical protein
MMPTWRSYFHRRIKTEVALKEALGKVEFLAIDLKKVHPESMFYDDNLLSNLSKSEYDVLISPGISETWDALRGLIKRYPPSEVCEMSVFSLDGLTCSKTGGYKSLEEFAFGLYLPHEYHDPNPIRFETDADFLSNIAHFESRFKHDGFVYHRAWDGKYFVANSDGAHHLAALYRQCKEQDRQYMIRCRIQEHTLDVHSCRLILKKYYPLIIYDESKYRLSIVLREFGMDCRLSTLLDECGIIYLPKQHRRSRMVYEFLLTNLEPFEIYDLHNYLELLVDTAQGTSA